MKFIYIYLQSDDYVINSIFMFMIPMKHIKIHWVHIPIVYIEIKSLQIEIYKGFHQRFQWIFCRSLRIQILFVQLRPVLQFYDFS